MLLEFAGVRPAESIQGISFAKFLKIPEAPFRKYVFSEHNWHDYEAYERSVRTTDFLYLINLRPALDSGGPIDANQSPAALALKRQKSRLTPLQNDAFMTPRPREEFFDNRTDSLPIINRIQYPAYEVFIVASRQVLKTWQTETGDTAPETVTPGWYDRENGKLLPTKDKWGEMPGRAKKADRINTKGPF